MRKGYLPFQLAYRHHVGTNGPLGLPLPHTGTPALEICWHLYTLDAQELFSFLLERELGRGGALLKEGRCGEGGVTGMLSTLHLAWRTLNPGHRADGYSR